ncbi:hypothetical protein B0H10DRAFT_1363283 [Mycena sp. CBHHK59/15]|nr:hypothetical protein B0H10DRAFT_1363283 [Mycena sp. CBHHK59/15]
MVQYFEEMPPSLCNWINQQQVFWVGTSPLAADGHINLSPKGGEGMFHIVNSRQVWYEDLTGSGVETISHLRENGRITVLFNAFEGPPRIARLYGHGTVFEFGSPEYSSFIPADARKPGSRSVVLIEIHKVGTSCGYAVPFFDFKAHRTRLLTWAAKKESLDNDGDEGAAALVDGLKRYWNTKNLKSLDGLTGLTTAPFTSETFQPTQSIYKPDNEKTGKRLGDMNLLVGFSIGILAASLYVRLSR